jgi:small subunit ribosomal protein S2
MTRISQMGLRIQNIGAIRAIRGQSNARLTKIARPFTLQGYPRLARPERGLPFPGRMFVPNAGRSPWRHIAGVPFPRSFFVTALVKDLVEAGVHFGHRASRWNPKMRPYIYARKNLIHIIDVRQTVRGLLRAKKYLTQLSSRNSLILFVGTKRQAADTVQREADRCGMPYVNDRWLGGSLTNYRTIRSRLSRLEELETIREGEQINTYSKKMQSALSREYRKMFRNLNGMRTMSRLPECLIVIDPKKEKNAINEARKMGVATIALIDTDCDPDLVDLPIPGNDDSMRSIEIVIKMLADAIIAGKGQAAVQNQTAGEGADKQ